MRWFNVSRLPALCQFQMWQPKRRPPLWARSVPWLRQLFKPRSWGQRHLPPGRHCRPGATDRQAAFAFQLAREVTGRTEATYRAGEGSRAGLMLDPAFAAAFTVAKERIRPSPARSQPL